MKDIPEDPRIPPAFRREGVRNIRKVGQLIDALSRLPRNLRMDTGFADALQVTVSRHVMGTKQRFECSVQEQED